MMDMIYYNARAVIVKKENGKEMVLIQRRVAGKLDEPDMFSDMDRGAAELYLSEKADGNN